MVSGFKWEWRGKLELCRWTLEILLMLLFLSLNFDFDFFTISELEATMVLSWSIAQASNPRSSIKRKKRKIHIDLIKDLYICSYVFDIVSLLLYKFNVLSIQRHASKALTLMWEFLVRKLSSIIILQSRIVVFERHGSIGTHQIQHIKKIILLFISLQ